MSIIDDLINIIRSIVFELVALLFYFISYVLKSGTFGIESSDTSPFAGWSELIALIIFLYRLTTHPFLKGINVGSQGSDYLNEKETGYFSKTFIFPDNIILLIICLPISLYILLRSAPDHIGLLVGGAIGLRFSDLF